MPMNLPCRFVSWSDNVKTVIDMPIIQKNCLTTAVYFEFRSESELGQLAVAMVVLNRAQTSNSSLCGIVYKGANHSTHVNSLSHVTVKPILWMMPVRGRPQ